MTAPHIALGKRAEQLANRYLKERNFRILDTNWSRPWGELDIVAKLGDDIHFIEVKGERMRVAGFEAYRRANERKLRKVVLTARTWLAQHNFPAQTPWQIDIVAVTILEHAGHAKITHFKNVKI